ncbi:hypothetical protein CDD83_7251 [Cordyceps sp. RAO-2017]|nr:hypothetical protein CDD83_7251 [Cordyceps sp. RAO-2017]
MSSAPPPRSQSNIMDAAMRAAYGADSDTAQLKPARVRESVYGPGAGGAPNLDIYPPGQVPIDQYRVRSMPATEVTDASEATWRTWRVDQNQAGGGGGRDWRQDFR